MASIYHYQDSKAIQKEILEFIEDPKSQGCSSLTFSANASLTDEAALALANSHLRKTVRSIEFHEIWASVAAFKALLSMPALEELYLYGGVSYDWAGPEYVWATLESEHLDVFRTDPNAQRLKVLVIDKQQMGEDSGRWLRAALPGLQQLTVERESY